MPYIKIMIHYIWATKNRAPLITTDLKPILLIHIKENSNNKNIFIDTLNCVKDHIHLLISLGSEQSIAQVAKLIKGESSYWINKQNLLKHKFEWQEEYMALSVSETIVPKVRQYIKNQEEHHKKKTFAQEYEEFINFYRFNNE